MRNLFTRARTAWRRSSRRPVFDTLALAYAQRCACGTYPVCPHTTDQERAHIAADMAETPEGLRRINDAVALSVLRWKRSIAVLETRCERWERLGPAAGSYGAAARELRNLIAAMREGAPR